MCCSTYLLALRQIIINKLASPESSALKHENNTKDTPEKYYNNNIIYSIVYVLPTITCDWLCIKSPFTLPVIIAFTHNNAKKLILYHANILSRLKVRSKQGSLAPHCSCHVEH